MVRTADSTLQTTSTARGVALALGATLMLGTSVAAAAAECVVRGGHAEPTASDVPSELQGENMQIIFAANFDNLPDFANRYREKCEKDTDAECARTPEGFTHFRSGERFHPEESGDSSKHASIEINSFQSRGGSGKSYLVWDESYGGKSQWGSDSQLAHEFDTEYKDIYYEFWIKFQPGYRWDGVESGGGRDLGKLSRLVHYDQVPGTNMFKFFGDGYSAPIALMDIVVNTKERDGVVKDKIFFENQVRCDPQPDNYKCGSYDHSREAFPAGSPTFIELLGDGNWHKLGMRAAMNSAPGVRDGRLAFWIDDVLVQEDTDVPFIGNGGDPNIGWNTLMLGGNMHNVPEPESAQFEQWYAIDDVRAYSID